MAEVSEIHSLGWWPSHRLDGTPTFLRTSTSSIITSTNRRMRLRIVGGGMAAAEAAADRAAAAADAAAQGLTTVGGAPPIHGAPASPPPPSFRPLKSFEEWTQGPRRPSGTCLFENPTDYFTAGG